ncbi:hypothetical protein FOCC_FOCC010939 [Frankliniella occidentalis]|nr:hypothetical protein FOCC_FOCC010939 [Frankliniella occidentalis]
MKPSEYGTIRVANKALTSIEGEFLVPFDIEGVVRVMSVLLCRVHGVQHHINTGDAKRFRFTYYNVNPRVLTDVNTELDRRLREDIVERADSPWQSPLLIIPKKDKGFRWAVDFRKLNSVIETSDSAYPLPRINPMLAGLRGAALLSTIDIISYA